VALRRVRIEGLFPAILLGTQPQGEHMKAKPIARIVEKHNNDRDGIISTLQDIQAQFGYLPESALRIVAKKTGCSLVDLFGVATFYKSFTLKPRGRHLISVCMGTACHVRGAPVVAGEFERQLGIKAGETTQDNEFTLETVNCLGACALGPMVVVDGHYFANVTTGKVKNILKKARVGLDTVDTKTDERVFPINVHCSRCNHSLMDRDNLIDDYPSVRVTISFNDEHGWLRLSCLYGSYNFASEYEIPLDRVVHFFCPHCHAELIASSNCPQCGAPMVPMIVRRGGMVQICSRRGCKEHMLDLNGVNF
jgi:NADH:ubiquinone oxidoreductase subunit E